MRIGIVGGGAAGLICAWLLEADHDVTLFEAAPALGGHATSHAVTIDGQRFSVDPGFHFVSQTLQPTFVRLLDVLHVATLPYRMTCTFFDANSSRALALPPLGNLHRMTSALTPRAIKTLMQLLRTLSATARLQLERDSDQTLESFLAKLNLPEAFTREFLYPFLGSNWGVPDAEVGTFSAPNALLYAYRNRGVNPRWLEVEGGMHVYVHALRTAIPQATFHTGCAVRSVRPDGDGCEITDDTGRKMRVDRVIFAGSAEASRGVLDGAATEATRRILGAFEYFDTKIAIHGDSTVMPRDPALWSVVNLRREGPACAIHHWAGWRTRTRVFRSWVTHAPRPASPLYAEFNYRHPRPTPGYFAGQRALARIQGDAGLWFAGMYTGGYDNHESAVLSALNIARRLSPDSANLRRLEQHTT